MVGTEGHVQEVARFLGQFERTPQQRGRGRQRACPGQDAVADHGVHLPAIAGEVSALHQRDGELAEAKAVVMIAEAGPDRQAQLGPRQRRCITMTVLEAQIRHAHGDDVVQVLVDEHRGRQHRLQNGHGGEKIWIAGRGKIF